MNRITTLLALIFTVIISLSSLGQNCPEPTADTVQYVCTGSNDSLDDLDVTAGGTLVWYADQNASNNLPGSTGVVDGETYYVANDEGGCESNIIPVTVYVQSVEFDVSPSSCVDLGANIFFVEEGDLGSPVEIEVNNLDGNPYDEEIIWSSNIDFSEIWYYYHGSGALPVGPHTPMVATLGPSDPIYHIEFYPDLYDITEFDLDIPVGDGCPPSDESLTIIAGALEFGICFEGGETLADAYAEFEHLWEGADNNPEWYDESTGGSVMPGSTKVIAEEIYFLDFDVSGCNVRIPVDINYEHPAPVASEEQYFCSSTAWSLIGITDDETLDDLAIDGDNLQWYDGSYNPISNPGNEVLKNGDVYYVTDEINGCKSEPRRIELTERECGCEDSDYEFYSHSISSSRDNNACAVDFFTHQPSLITPGTTNGMNGNQDDAVYVTPGKDPNLDAIGIDLPRTSPYGTGVSRPIRLNTDKSGSATRVFAHKNIVAGEIVAFDFALILENPSHSHDQQPFFEVNVYDSNDQVVQTRCVVSDPDDCIFHDVGSTNNMSNVLYSEWSSIILDTREIMGEAGRVEFIVSWCSPTAHVGYAYVDNVFVGNNGDQSAGEQSFGFMDIVTIEDGSLIYDDDCSYLETNVQQEECEAVLPALNPDFPIDVCGNLENPVASASCDNPLLSSIELDIYKEGNIVGTINQANTSPSGSEDFCFEINESDISGPLYGYFNLKAGADFEMSPNSGSSYNYEVTTQNSGFKICPVAECVPDMAECVSAGGPLEYAFDLTLQDPIALSGYTDTTIFEVTYYESLADAENVSNAVPTPTAFPATGTHEIFLRVDYDWQAIGLTPEDNCYDIISFEVTVSVEPELPVDPVTVEYCEIEGQVDYIFDLGLQDLRDDILAQVSGVKPDYDLEFYHSNAGATAQDATDLIDTPGAHEVSITNSPSEVWVRIIAPGDCWSILKIDLFIHDLPILLSDQETIFVCEDASNPGVGVFDLESVESNIVDPALGYDVAYFDVAGNIIANPGTHPGSDGDIITVVITDESTNLECETTAEIELSVVDVPPIPVQIPLKECDDGSGQATFDLDDLIPDIQDGDASLEVDFYGSQAEADDPTNSVPLVSPYTSGSTTVVVRVGIAGLECYDTRDLDLIVNPLPDIPVVDTLAACENPDGSDSTFDLTNDSNLIDDILDGRAAADFDVTFYTNRTDAEAPNAPIDDVTTGSTIDVWVRIKDNTTGCFSVFDIDFKVNPLPQINSPVELRICDDGGGNGTAEFNLNNATAIMVGLGSNYNVTYYELPGEADTENPDPQDELSLNYTNIVPFNHTIYARIQDKTTGCYITEPVILEVDEAPEANTPPPIIYCDVNNDGKGTFYLPDANDDITTDPNATITYHKTEADAKNAVNLLPDTVDNNMININQPIYVRVEVPGVDCYTIVELELIVEPTPELEEPSGPLIGCDYDDTGIVIFDLVEIVEDEVLVLIPNPEDYGVAYYVNQTDRDNDVPIASPGAYASQTGTVIVVVTNPSTGCWSEVEIELFVAPMPEVFPPAHMEVCNVSAPSDEKEFFYLDEAIPEITGGDTSLTVTFHETQADADDGVDELTIPYENTENNQTIYIRVENEFGCEVTDTITLTLVVNPLPAPVIPDPYEVCDVDNEGFVYFDLDSLEDEIIANEPDVNISFHETNSDAENGVWPLASPYQNIVAGEQTIYARVYFDDVPDGTGCFTVIEVIIRAIPSPVVPTELDDLYFCTADVDTGVRVNLTVYEMEIYGLQDVTELDLTYHLSQADAEIGNAPIADPENYLLNPPTPTTIFVRLGYTDGECFSIVPFTLHLVEGPEINDPSPLSQCSLLGEPNSETSVFDLLDKREEIIGNVTGFGIYFYEEENDALAGNNNYIQDPTNYTNIENPQTIYVRVIDSQENEEDTGCVAFTTLTLRVDPNPEPVAPDPIEICHLDTDAETTIVDLTIRELQILNQEAWELEYYEKYRDAVNGDQDEVIGNPDAYELALTDSPKTIYVRVINDASGCFEIVELEVILSQLPEFVTPEDIDPMIVCTTDGKERAMFDLTTKIPEIFGNQNLDGLDIFFYEELIDAIDGVNPIIDPEVYYNGANPQTIYVGVGNPDIDECYIGGLTYFEIEVLEGAVAHSPEESYKVCGIPGENGDVGTFDLLNLDFIDEILGMQDPDFFDVDYFLTEEDAHEGATEDALSSPYENITNPQVIFARVTNQETGCYTIAEVTLEVIPLPGLILEDVYSFCTDESGNPMEDADGNVIFPIIDTGLEEEGHEFTWYFKGDKIVGQVGPSLEADQIGTYTVEIVSHDTGCTLSLDIEVVESSMPFTYGAEVTSPAFSGLYNVDAWAEGFGDYWFSLDGGTPQEEGSWSNVGAGSHIVTITDMNGCGSVEVIVNVIDYPKFFTPNDDGYNDTWNIPGMADLDPSAEIFIFDRHGKLLKQINPSSQGWDGTFNGKPLPSTDYWFVVKYEEDGEPKEFKGHFSLKR